MNRRMMKMTISDEEFFEVLVEELNGDREKARETYTQMLIDRCTP